jgi:hypothetical protein
MDQVKEKKVLFVVRVVLFIIFSTWQVPILVLQQKRILKSPCAFDPVQKDVMP